MEENLLSSMGMGSKTTDSPYGFNTEFDKVTGTPLFGLGGEGLVPELKKDEEEKKKAEDDTLKTLSSMFDEKPEEQKDFREGVLPSASGVSEKPEAIAGSIENFDNIFKNVPYNVDVEQASRNQRYEDLDKPFSEDRKVKAGNKEYVIKAGETKQDLINKLNKEQAFRSEEEKRNLIEEAKKTPKPFETPAIPRFGLEPVDKQEDKQEVERRSLIQDLQSGKITYANITPQQADILAGPGIKIEQDWTNKRNQIQQAIEDAKASKLAGDTAVSLINNIVPLHKLYGTELTNKMIFDAGVNAYANGLAGSKNPNGYRKAFMAGVALNAPSLIGGATSASFATGLSTVLGVNPWLRLGIGLGTFIGVEKSLSKIIDKALSYIPENSFGISKEQIEKLAKENPEAFNMGSHLAVATAFRPSLSLRNILSGSASLGGLQTVNEVVDILGDPDKKATDFNVQNVINAALTGAVFNKANFGARWERANTPETQTRVRNLLTELEKLKKSPAEVDASGNVIPKQQRALQIKNEILKIDPFFETRLNSIFEINGEISQVGSRIQAFANKNNLTPNQLERLIKAGKLNTKTGLTKEFISDVKEFNKLNRSLNQVDPSGMARRYQFFQQQPGPSGYGPGHEERWRERSEREAQGEMGMEVPGQPQAEAVATVPATTAVPVLTTESMRNVSQIVDAVTPLIPEAAEPARTHEQVMTSFEPPKPTEPVVETTKPTEPVVEAVKPVEPLAEAVKPTEPSEPVTSGRVVNVGGQSYTLTKEQNERWQKEILPEEENIKRILEDGKRGLARGNRTQYEQSLSTSKGYSMRLSAIKRDIVGAYTAREQQAIDARAKSNYIGKPVNILVQGIRVPGKITKNVFGRVTVKLDSGESVTVSKEDVLPIEEQPKSRAVESKPILPTEQDPYKKFEELNFEVEHSNDPSPENVLELAKMYQKGIGTSQDINKARELFVMANDIDPKVGGRPLADFTTEYNQYINKRAMESKPISPASDRLKPLEGIPQIKGATGPDKDVVSVVDSYAKKYGVPYQRQKEYVKVDEKLSKQIADAYENMKDDPTNPAVKEAYQDFIRQTRNQYDELEKAGYKFKFYDSKSDPYGGNPFGSMRDIRNNKEMSVYGTYDGYGEKPISPEQIEKNPMLVDTGLRWPDQQGVMRPVTANDLFRAVHDVLGHGIEGAGFRAQGEENAWQAHARLYTGPAVAAMTSETRGQNSWLNYNDKPLRNLVGDARAKELHPDNWETITTGEHNRTANISDTIFAEQKVGLMPEWSWKEGLSNLPAGEKAATRLMESKPLSPEPPTISKKNVQELDKALSDYKNGIINQDALAQIIDRVANENVLSFGETIRQLDASLSRMGETSIYRGVNAKTNIEKRTNVLAGMKRAVDMGALSKNGYDMFEFMVRNLMDESILQNLSVEISPETYKGQIGLFDPRENKVVLYFNQLEKVSELSFNQSPERTFAAVHEVSHYLSQFLPPEIKAEINKSYTKEINTKLKEVRMALERNPLDAEAKLKQDYLLSSLSAHVSPSNIADSAWDKAGDIYSEFTDNNTRNEMYQFRSPDEYAAENLASLVSQKWGNYETARKAFGKNSPQAIIAKRKLIRISKAAANQSIALSRFIIPKKVKAGRFAGKTLTRSEGQQKTDVFEKSLDYFKTKKSEEAVLNKGMMAEHFDGIKEILGKNNLQLFAEAKAAGEKIFSLERRMESKPEIRGEGEIVPFKQESYDNLINDITNPSSEIFKMALSQVRQKGLNRAGDSNDIATSLLSEVFFPESGDTLEVKWQSGQGLATPRGIVFKDPVDYIKHQLDSAANRLAKLNGMEVSAESMVTEEGDTGASVMDRINLENEGAVIPQDVAVVSQQGEKSSAASIKAISEATIDFLNSASERGEFFSGRQYAQSSLSERQMLSQIASNFYFLNNFNRMLSEYGIIEKQRGKIIALNNARLAVDNFVNQYGNTEKFGSPEFIRSNPTIKIWLSGTNGANQLSKNTVARIIAPRLQTHLVKKGLLPEVFEPKENENVPAKRYSIEGSIEEQISKLHPDGPFYHLQTTKDLIKSFTEDYRKLFESFGFNFDNKNAGKFYGLYDRTLNPNDTPDIAAFEESKRQSQKESMSARAIIRKRLDELTKQNALKLYQAKKEFVTQRNVDTGKVRTLASKPLPTGEAGKDSGLVSEEKDFGVVNYEEARQRGVNLPSTNKPAGIGYWAIHAASVAYTLNTGFGMYQNGNPDAVANAVGIWLAGTYGLHAIRNVAISTARILKSQRSISIPKNALLPFTERIEASTNRFLQAIKDKGAANAVFDAAVKAIDNKYNLIPFDNRFNLVVIQKAANAAVHMVKASASRLDNFVNGIEDPVIQNQVRTDMRDFLNPSNRLGPNVKDLMDKWKEYQKQLKIQSDLSKNGIDVKDERYDAYIRAQQAYENALNSFKNSKNQIRQAATTRLEKLLSKELMKDLTDIRASAVEIQNLWLSSGAIDKDTAQRIEFTLDDHIRKVYLAYRDRDAWLAQPDFAEKRTALINEIANANYSKSGSGISAPGSKADYIAEATAYVDSIINDSNWFVVNQDRVITDSFLRNAVKGLNKKNLQERMRLNKATEEFLGLIKNPLVGVVDGQTIDRTALVNLQLSKSLADYALKAGLAIPVSNLKNGQVPDGFIKMKLVNPEKNPFIADNVWHKSMIPVIQDLVMPGFQNPGGIIGDALKKIIGLKKASLTVFNTSLWLSQLPSNMVLLTMHGDLLNTRFLSNISALLQGAYVKTADVFNFQPLRKILLEGAVPGEDFETFMKLAYDYGHLSTGTTAFDVREIFKDSDTPHKLDWWMNKFGDAFSIADTAMRFSAIVSRYQQVRDEAIKRAQSGGKMLSMEEIFKIASKEVYLYYPEMSMLPSSIKTLSQFGILQPFVSFPVNIIRGVTNALVENVKIAVENDPITRPRAIWKLSNLLTVLTLFGSAAIDSMFDKDPEKSLDDNSIESAKMLDPRNPTAASGVDWRWRDREAGIIEYRDSKQLIPNASVNNIVAYLNRYANAKTDEEKTAALKSVATQFKDFATFDPAGSLPILTLVESLAPGKTIRDGELVDKNLTYSGLNTVERYLAAAGTSFRTTDMNTLIKLLKTTDGSINPTTGKPWEAKDILSRYTTMPIRTMSVNGTVRKVTGELNSEMNELRDNYSKEYLNTPISGMAIDGMVDKQKDFIKFGQAMRSTMDNAEKLGRSRYSIVQAMRSAGMEEGDIASVISRDYGNIMSINKFTEKIVNNKFSKIYDNTIKGGRNKQLGRSLSDAFRSTWRGYFITSLVDGKSNSEKFSVVSEGNYEAKNINMIELNRKIIENYITNASIDMSSVTKKDILNYYQDVLKYLDQFKSWEDFKSKHPESSGLYKSFLSDYLEFEGKQLPRKSKVKEKRR